MPTRSTKQTMKKFFIKSILKALQDPEVEDTLWRNLHRPARIDKPGPEDIWLNLWRQAGVETAKYVTDHMLTTKPISGRFQLFDLSLSKAPKDGLFLEFGAGYKGGTINYLAKQIDGTIHGFDSFEGLPEDWFGVLGKGSLSTDGVMPKVSDNVMLHKGWFDKSIPEFLQNHDGNVAFMHIDCDLYSSTKVIFDLLRNRIVTGTVIQFDEYFNYPGWQHHEFKAFHEYLSETQSGYEYLGYDRKNFAVGVRIL